METPTKIIQFKSEKDLKAVLAANYMKQVENLFGDKDRALEFLTNVGASVQRNPKLLDCTPETLLNSFMVMASLKLMPSGVSGEAFVIPYAKGGVQEAQFQLGYQGLVTLFYRAGAKSIVAEIVRENDPFSFLNGEVMHSPDVFSDNRGAPRGAYVVIELQGGGKITKVMSKKEILNIAEKFSKSYKSDFSPWKSNDPELWMWKKTVLKQAAKLVPKNETLNQAIAEDNKDSVISDRNEASKELPSTTFKPEAVAQLEAVIRDCKDQGALDDAWADVPADYKQNPTLRKAAEEMRAIFVNEGMDKAA